MLHDQTNNIIPLSKAGQKVAQKVMQPPQTKTHVSYNRAFLDAYQPNITYYLDEATRKTLLKMGSTDAAYPAGTYANRIFDRLLIDLSWNSSRLEGNTYSLLETQRLFEFDSPSSNKSLEETQMLLNHKAAIALLIDPNTTISRASILNLHALLSNNLLPNPSACGRLRMISVNITSAVYIPLAIPQLIEECFNQIIHTARAIADPFEQAFFLMIHLPYLQPFEDVNKRVSRLSVNIPFIRNNLCPLSFVDVPYQTYINGLLGIYEFNQIALIRDVFVWAYGRSASLYAATKQSIGNPDPFRIQYRREIANVIKQIAVEKMDMKTAHALIETQKISLCPTQPARFVNVVEIELMALHEGNIARYGISQSEYETWQANWQ